MYSSIIDKYHSFYFIGIGGVSMSGLAKYLLKLDKRVGGSDVAVNEYIEELMDYGVKIDFKDFVDEIENYDVVIYTDAINDENPRLRKARSLSKLTISRGKFLYEVSLKFDKVIAVSGCHGKTTCCAMLAHIFASAEKKFASHIGGNDRIFSNFYFCGSDYLITEACEYKKNFLHLKPDAAVILNSDADHLECYGNESEVKSAYINFSQNAKNTILLYKDLPEISGISFGFDKSADYFALDIEINNGVCEFAVYEYGKKLGNIHLKVYGKHNVLNALAATAVARYFGIDFTQISAGLNNFMGVERRFERLAEIKGVTYFADYAHHPNELRASLKTVRKIINGELFVIFQPHTYSRTKLLFDEFVKVLSPLTNLLIYKTFAAREYYDDAGSALTLSQSIKRASYGDCPDDINDFISKAEAGDTVIFLGAGDIYFIAKQLCSNLESRND